MTTPAQAPNAALISAAPAMYEALNFARKRLIEEFRTMAELSIILETQMGVTNLRGTRIEQAATDAATLRIIDAALAKARGETP